LVENAPQAFVFNHDAQINFRRVHSFHLNQLLLNALRVISRIHLNFYPSLKVQRSSSSITRI
jgi:hypothetical protein